MGGEIGSSVPAINRLVFSVLLILLIPYNTFYWVSTYGIGQDNGYSQLIRFAEEHVPASDPINASGDAVKFHYFFPDRQVTNAATPKEAGEMSVHYFVLVPKDVRSHYGRIKPRLAGWILAKGNDYSLLTDIATVIFTLYRVDYPEKAPAVKRNAASNILSKTSHWRSYQPAKGGYIGLFVSGLALWILLWYIILIGPAIVKFGYTNLWKPNRTYRNSSQPAARISSPSMRSTMSAGNRIAYGALRERSLPRHRPVCLPSS
jgi:hypothetical protein